MKQFIRVYLPSLRSFVIWLSNFLKDINPFISIRYLHFFKYYYFDIKQFKLKTLKLNLTIIGAEKGGSTFLHKKIDTHPQIFMSKPKKEPCFFMPKEYFNRYNLVYEKKQKVFKNSIVRGYKNEAILGESTPDYSASNFAETFGVSKKMVEYNPKIKILFILRNPIERIVSDYLAAIRSKKTNLDLNKAVIEIKHLVLGSLYYSQLKQYINNIPSENICIVFLEEIIDTPEVIFSEIFSFLNVDDFRIGSTERINPASNKSNYSKEDLKFSLELYQSIMPRIEEDIKKLEKHLNKKITCWDLSADRWVN